jgi:hypothetical protein
VKILCTSKIAIGQLSDISEQVVQLGELSNFYTLELLMRKSKRDITRKEMEDLLKSTSDKPLHSIP